MLDTLEEMQTIGGDEWEEVAEEHNEQYLGVPRSVESLRRKFASLANRPCPTGHTTRPLPVNRAKEITPKTVECGDIRDATMDPGHLGVKHALVAEWR